MEKIHWKKVFNSDYLGSCDIPEGKDIVLTISHVQIKKVKNTDGKEQERNIALFTDNNVKPMILNATNCKVIKKFAKSPYIDDWKNIIISVYVKDDIRSFGETTEGLRIRDIQPQLTKPILKEGVPAWNNAITALREGKSIDVIKSRFTIAPELETKLLEISK